MVRGVLFLLVCLSIIGWYVIGYKALYLNRAQGESLRFLEAFWQAKRLDAVYQEAEHKRRSPIAHMFKAGYVELSKLQNAKAQGAPSGNPGEVWHGEGDLENIERALRRAATHESTVLESMVPFLATVGIGGAVHRPLRHGHRHHRRLPPDRQPGLGQPRRRWRRASPRRSAPPRSASSPPCRRSWPTTGSCARSRCCRAEMDAFSNDFLNIVKRHFLR